MPTPDQTTPHRIRNRPRPREKPINLTALRAVIPPRLIPFGEALRLAQHQAELLLGQHPTYPPSIAVIADLPGVRLEYLDQKPSGASFWDTEDKRWIIQLNRIDSEWQQRYAAARELKHILDDRHRHLLYRDSAGVSPTWQAETAADYFARCLLVPTHLLRRAWRTGKRSASELAAMFNVAECIICQRMRDIGIRRRNRPTTRSSSDRVVILPNPQQFMCERNCT